MPLLKSLQNFDVANATVQVWLYKKSNTPEGTRFTGRWIDTDTELDQALRKAITDRRESILEVKRV
ncbi:MAG: hypothetical protein GEV13_32420 [Rhodospirillales bacterium]|nr:hypothetical protein [Rhodospirillales bacterium]